MELFKLFGSILVDTDAAEKSMQKVEELAEKTGNSLIKVGDKMSSVGEKLTLGITAPIAGIATAAVKTTADFESAMSEVSAISGATGEDLSKLEDLAKKMGETTKFSASDAAEGLKYMAMAGWKTEDMLGGLEGVMSLAAASGEDLGTTSDIVTDALTAFGLSAGDSGHFADILAAASSNANTNVSMMGETFKYCAPIAGALGFSAEDTAEAIGLMANAGIKSSQAGTSLRTIMNNLSGEVKVCGASIGEVTVATTNADGSMRGLSDILADCREAFSGLSESEKAAAAEALVGTNAMSGFLALMNAGEGDVSKLSEAIANCDGTAKGMADTMNDNLSGQLTLLKSQVEALLIQFGELVLPAVKQGVEWLSKVLDYISGLDDGTKEMIVKIGLLVAAVGPLLTVFGKGVSVIGTVISAGSKLSSGIGGIIKVGGGLLSGATKVSGVFSGIATFATGTLIPAIGSIALPVTAVIAGIAALVAAGVALYKNWDTIKEWAGKAWGAVKDTVGGVVDGIKGFFGDLKERVSGKFHEMTESVREKASEMKEHVVGKFQELKEGAAEKIHDLAQKGAEKFAELKEKVSEKASALKESVSGKFAELKENAVGKFTELRDAAAEKLGDLAQKGAEKFAELKEKASEKVSALKEGVAGKFQELKENAVGKFTEIKDSAADKFHELKESVGSKLGEMKDGAVEKISAMAEKVSSGFQEMKERGAEKFSDLKERWAGKFGETREKMASEAEEMKTKVSDSLAKLRDNAAERISDLAEKCASGFQNIREKGTDAAASLKETVSSRFSEMGDAVRSKFDGLGEKIQSTFSGVSEKVKDVVGKVKEFFNFDWQLPKIKLPHFKISGKLSLSPLSVPSIGVDWYKGGGIMTEPTAFGRDPGTGNIMVGGEAGPEAIAPIELLKGYVREAVEEGDGRLYDVLEAVRLLLAEYLPRLERLQLVLDTGTLVGETAPAMNEELGRIKHMRGRRN